jgi:hypothetical protein
VNPLSELTDEQTKRLVIIIALYDKIAIDATGSDLMLWAHWVATGRSVYDDDAPTDPTECEDTGWAPAVVTRAERC